MECKNCGQKFEGKFCNGCGQNNLVNKLSLQSFLAEISDSVFQINRGLFFTIKSLFTRPGHSIREFLNGQRKFYFKPIGFALLLSSFYFLVTKITGTTTFLAEAISGFRQGAEDKSEFSHNSLILEFSTEWLVDNFAYTTLLLIPIFSMASLISFYGKGQNYLEHIVINSYIAGQQAVFYSLFTLVDFLINKNDLMMTIGLLLSIVFRFWTFFQFYNTEKKLNIGMRMVLTYIVFYLAIMISLALLVVGLAISQKY